MKNLTIDEQKELHMGKSIFNYMPNCGEWVEDENKQIISHYYDYNLEKIKVLGVSDLISIGLLISKNIYEVKFLNKKINEKYQSYLFMLFKSLSDGLGIQNSSDFLLAIKTSGEQGLKARAEDVVYKSQKENTLPYTNIHSFERYFVQQLHLRAKAVNFIDSWNTTLEGDIWGTKIFTQNGCTEYSLGENLLNTKTWYTGSVSQIFKGILLLDKSICSLMEWDSQRIVTIKKLRDNYNFPDLLINDL